MSLFGFLNCNKPKGMTSRDLVNIVQGQLRGRRCKVGHCGTLDPLAEGVLVVGLGPAVRLVPMVQDQAKHYRGTFQLGAQSPTGDLEFEPTLYPDLPQPTADQLRAAATGLTGLITQVPPAYSAVRVDGRRAYDRVRSGQSVEMPSRTVRIDQLDVLDYEFPIMELDVVCGSGTYMRSLGMDLAQAVGSTAVMTSLTRVGVGPFRLEDSISVEQIRRGPLEDLLMPPALAVVNLPQFSVGPEDDERLGNGQTVQGRPILDGKEVENADLAAAMTERGDLRALVKPKNGLWGPYRVFPEPS
ncbi:tRNA pseudouridine(55) synthase TruB [Stieleria varia]|uniref:tRNA pseudouridine(55) synthase TruB n=1 Tax=Stieleria varia TaxID=2528005 RepID=UPI0021BC5057|nr:tRNA pseudouridine(55) synthase TruB [Stieleria varia]